MFSPPILLPILTLLPLFGAVVVALMPQLARRRPAWTAGIVALAGLGVVLLGVPSVFSGEVLRWRVEWVPSLGLSFGFRVDGLSWLFALLITAVGALVILYASYYLSASDSARRFFMFLLIFMGAMLGIVLADNLLLLVVFWELTSLASFLLIGYWNTRSDARDGARMALAVTGGGGLALLAGVVLIGQIVGSFDLDQVLMAGARIRAHPLYLPALVLVLLGCFTKSAQFPFHFWLPHAMAAPTPVSAYLHSATMVKAGVFLLARMYPALGGSEPWFWLVTLTGLTTLLIGAYIAIFKHDLKGLLAYSTISHLGLITLLFGLDEQLAVVAGVFHIVNHATFKASLFMAAGIIDHETGSRDMRQLNGLWKYMPYTGALAMVATAAMAGVPLANGFLSKEMFFAETLAKEGNTLFTALLPLGVMLAAIFSVTYSARFIHDVFFNGEPTGLVKTPHEPPLFMSLPVGILVVLCLVVGLLPALTVGPILAVAGQAALFGGFGGVLPEYKLAIWHGLSPPLLMSVTALVGGVALYFGLQKFINLHRLVRLPLWIKHGGHDAFVGGIDVLIRSAKRITQLLQNGQLQHYLFLLIVLILVAGMLPFLRGVSWSRDAAPTTPAGFAVTVVVAIGIVCTVATVIVHRKRLMALLMLGAVGLMISLAFVYLSAPDLALTQLLVEVVTIVLMMLALHWLPSESALEGAPFIRNTRKWRDVLIAVATGGGVAMLTYAMITRPFDSISPYFLRTTAAEGGGTNTVNVIIVDYRGFDTMGEITVLAIAGIVVLALLAGHRRSYETAHEIVTDHDMRHSLSLALVSQVLLPLATLVSIYLFLRGHNQPGGGFIAGLVLAIVLILHFVAKGGSPTTTTRANTDFRNWIGWGLLIAGGTGMGSWFVNHPFLTSTHGFLDLPLIGSIPLASASLFDLGVYLTVVGATLVALQSIECLKEKKVGA